MEQQMATVDPARWNDCYNNTEKFKNSLRLLGGYTMDSEIEKVVQGLQLWIC